MIEMKYYEFINEISKDELIEGLIGYGFFAEKIPPMFTSIPLYEFCRRTGYSWTIKKDHSAISYESIRNISVPRLLSIPHPAGYVNQCKYIHDVWDDLKTYFYEKTKDQTFKISRIHIRKLKDRKELFEMNYKNGVKDGYPETDISIGARYLVKADISNCFPSIYTHAVSWALVGLEVAKRNQNDHTKWYNILDFYTRALKENETHGILIGPHSSNVISEIILCAVDYLLFDKYKFTRDIDDYACYVKSHQEAEEFLINLSSTLKNFGLSLNHKKTEIIKLPYASEASWKTTLNSIQLPEKISIPFLKHYLDSAIELVNKTGNVAIIYYAIKVLSEKEFYVNAKTYYFKTIHHLIIIYPYLLPIIDEYVLLPLSIVKDDIKNLSNNILHDGVKFKRYDAISFAIYFALKYDFELSETNFLEMSKKSEDCIFMVLAFLYDKKNNPILMGDYKSLALALQLDIMEMDKYWLFLYEVLTKEELLDPQYKSLKNGRVSFIKSL